MGALVGNGRWHPDDEALVSEQTTKPQVELGDVEVRIYWSCPAVDNNWKRVAVRLDKIEEIEWDYPNPAFPEFWGYMIFDKMPTQKRIDLLKKRIVYAVCLGWKAGE